jgi:hypothetical protein
MISNFNDFRFRQIAIISDFQISTIQITQEKRLKQTI